MKLILVRHGETAWVKERRYQGSTDVPLNARGKLQARSVARLIKKEQPIAVYSSELARAHETAGLIANACKKRVKVDGRLNEIFFGHWEGKPHRAIWDQFPKEAQRWYEARWTSKPPGGESLGSLKNRVSSFLKETLKCFGDQDATCVIVSHGGPIRMFMVELFEMNPKIFWSLRIDTASVSVITVKPKWSELVLLNSQAHLNGLRRGGHAA